MQRSLMLFISLVALFVISTAAQDPTRQPTKDAAPATPAPPVNPCPQLTLTNPFSNRIAREGESLTFGAVLSGGDAKAVPTFVWSTSTGTILSGQSSRSITVDSTGAGQDRQLTADLWVGGYPGECSLQASTTVKVAGPARKVAEFGELTSEKEAEQLDALISALSSTNDNAYIFGYAGRTSVRGYTLPILRRMKARLVAANIPVERLGVIDGGFREQPSFELWISPLGAEPPKPTPTIKARDIVYPKTTPAKKT